MCIILVYYVLIKHLIYSIIATLTLLVSNMDSSAASFHRYMDHLNLYMQYRKLPTELKDKIRHYKQYMWSVLKGVDEDQFLKACNWLILLIIQYYLQFTYLRFYL